MYFKQIYVKIVKTDFEKLVASKPPTPPPPPPPLPPFKIGLIVLI